MADGRGPGPCLLAPHELRVLTAPWLASWSQQPRRAASSVAASGVKAGVSPDPDSLWEGATRRHKDRESSISGHVPRTSPWGSVGGSPRLARARYP